MFDAAPSGVWFYGWPLSLAIGLPHQSVDAPGQPTVSEVGQRLAKPQYGVSESEKCRNEDRPGRHKNEERRMECTLEPNLRESQRHRKRHNEYEEPVADKPSCKL